MSTLRGAEAADPPFSWWSRKNREGGVRTSVREAVPSDFAVAFLEDGSTDSVPGFAIGSAPGVRRGVRCLEYGARALPDGAGAHRAHRARTRCPSDDTLR